MEEQFEFDFNEILNQFRSGKRLTGKDGLLAPLIKQLTEAALEAEVESHIANDVLGGKSNRKNTFNVWFRNELYRYLSSHRRYFKYLFQLQQ